MTSERILVRDNYDSEVKNDHAIDTFEWDEGCKESPSCVSIIK